MSTAPQARTLDAAHVSAGYNRADNNQPVDIAHLKRVVTLAMVLSRYGILNQLKRSGAQLAGCCPIHDGSDPRQFVVHLTSNNWFCFGDCNRGGSMLDLVALKERISIPAAAQLIAQWFAITPSASTARPRAQPRRKAMSSRPSHRLFIVEERPADGGGEKKSWWHAVGAAWPQLDGKGLSIQLIPGVAVSGRLVLREHTAEEDEARPSKPSNKKSSS